MTTTLKKLLLAMGLTCLAAAAFVAIVTYVIFPADIQQYAVVFSPSKEHKAAVFKINRGVFGSRTTIVSLLEKERELGPWSGQRVFSIHGEAVVDVNWVSDAKLVVNWTTPSADNGSAQQLRTMAGQDENIEISVKEESLEVIIDKIVNATSGGDYFCIYKRKFLGHDWVTVLGVSPTVSEEIVAFVAKPLLVVKGSVPIEIGWLNPNRAKVMCDCQNSDVLLSLTDVDSIIFEYDLHAVSGDREIQGDP